MRVREKERARSKKTKTNSTSLSHRPALPAAAVDGLLLDLRGGDGVDDLLVDFVRRG